jgi:uncharacterized cupin superfamily protein
MAKAIAATGIPEATGTSYPPPFDGPVTDRGYRRLGLAFGLSQFGVNLARLAPGVWSSQRHWHALEEEFVYVLEGEVAMITDDGEQLCRAGDCVGFKAGTKDGHHFINRGTKDVVLLLVGSRFDGDSGEYPDIDMIFTPRDYAAPSGPGLGYAHKDGTPYA